MRYFLGNPSHSPTQRNNSLRQSLQNVLQRQQRIDVFNISLLSAGRFRASLTGIARHADIDLKLFHPNGKLVAASRHSGHQSEVISITNLGAGNYKLQAILKRGSKSKYQLHVGGKSRSGIVLDTDPLLNSGSDPQSELVDNAVATATNRGKISALPATFAGRLGKEDNVDWYTFTLGETGSASNRLNLTLSGDAGVFASIYSASDLSTSSGSVVAYGGRNWLGSSKLALKSDTYFVKISPIAGNSVNYKLNLAATEIRDQAGNTKETAFEINNMQPVNTGQSFTVTDFVGHGDVFDYYRFRTDAKSTLAITFDRLSNDNPNKTRIQYQLDQADGLPAAKLYWKNAQGVSLSGGIDALTESSYMLSGELEPGIYTLQLKSYFYDGDNNYRVTFSATS